MKIKEKKPAGRKFTLEVSEPELQYIEWCVGRTTAEHDREFADETGVSIEDACCDEMYEQLGNVLDPE